MTIEEVKRRKEELEVMIKDKLIEFQNNTGAKIEEITIESTKYKTITNDDVSFIENVKVEVKL